MGSCDIKLTKTKKKTAKKAAFFLVDLVGFEPMTSALRTQRSPS